MSGRSTAKTPIEPLPVEAVEAPSMDDPLAMFSGGMVVVADVSRDAGADLSNIAGLVEVTKEIALPAELSGSAPASARVAIDGSDPDEVSAVRVVAGAARAPERTPVTAIETPAAVSPAPREAPATVPTVDDGRMRDAEALIGQGRWARVVEHLAPVAGAPRAPANLGLLYAIALRECEVGGEPRGTRPTEDAGRLAIEAISALLGVSPESPVAILVARRLLRRTTWRSKPAPPPRTSLFIAVTAVVVGSVVGWLLGPGQPALQHALRALHHGH